MKDALNATQNSNYQAMLNQLLILCFCAWILSLKHFFYLGDIFYYDVYYTLAQTTNLELSYKLYQNFLSSREPIYFILVNIFAKLLPYSLFTSILNFTLLTLLFQVLKLFKVKSYWYFFAVTNFYTLMLLFSADRLKLALIFFLAAAISRKRLAIVAFLVLSLLAHIQILIILPVFIFLIKKIDLNSLKRIIQKHFVFIVIAAGGLLSILGNYALEKVLHYLTGFQFISMLKVLFFLALTFLASKKEDRIPVMLSFIPLILAGAFLASNRVSFLGYLIFAAYSLCTSRQLTLNTLLAMFFTLKGAIFIVSGILTGEGFIITPNSFLAYLQAFF